MPRIMIVEDDSTLSCLMSDMLERWGYEPLLYDEGTRVIEDIKNFQPDLVLLDVLLRGKDGYTIMKELSADESLRSVPVVLITALTQARAMFERFDQIHVFLPKPFDLLELLSAVRHALGEGASAAPSVLERRRDNIKAV